MENNEVAKNLAELAEQINAEHRAFLSTFRTSLELGIRVGELLTQAKEQCPHGTWLPWLEKNFEGSARRAQDFMRLFNHRDQILSKTQDSAHLSIGEALRELASPRVVYDEPKGADPERVDRTTEFILKPAVRPSPEPKAYILRMPGGERAAEPDEQTAEPEDGPQSSQEQGEAMEKPDGWHQSYFVSQMIYLVEFDLVDRSNEKLMKQLGYLRHLLNEFVL